MDFCSNNCQAKDKSYLVVAVTQTSLITEVEIIPGLGTRKALATSKLSSSFLSSRSIQRRSDRRESL